MKTYKTSQGDTWDIIALRMYPGKGGEKLMHTLLQHNPKHAWKVIFPAGIELFIPKVDIPLATDLPPWLR